MAINKQANFHHKLRRKKRIHLSHPLTPSSETKLSNLLKSLSQCFMYMSVHIGYELRASITELALEHHLFESIVNN